MGEYFDQLDEKVAEHLKSLTAAVDAPAEEALELLSKAWVEKEEIFAKKIIEEKMELVDFFDPEEEKGGALLLTYSGSILSIGPEGNEGRNTSYASIGIRKDVPELAEAEDGELAGKVAVGDKAEFVRGPIQSSSPIYKIAIFSAEMDAEEEEELLSEVTQLLAEDFAEVNRTIISG